MIFSWAFAGQFHHCPHSSAHLVCSSMCWLLDRCVIVLEELLKRLRQLIALGRYIYMSVKRPAAEVLQAGHAGGQGSEQLQRNLLLSRVNEVCTPIHSTAAISAIPISLDCRCGCVRSSSTGHVMMYEFQDTIKPWHSLRAPGVCLQEEGAGITLDAQVLGARSRLHTQGEEVVVVRAVPHQEGAWGLLAQQGAGLLATHSVPVEAALLQFAHGCKHHLVLCPRAEGLEAVGGQAHFALEGAAAHGAVKPAVRYHGALPAPCPAQPLLGLGVQGRGAVPARVRVQRGAATQNPELHCLLNIQKQ